MITKEILGTVFEVLDAKEMITLADSFVMNKIGTGHGEGKLYVGNYNEETKSFGMIFLDQKKNASCSKPTCWNF